MSEFENLSSFPEIKAQVKLMKVELKSWEHSFLNENGRKPKKDDILQNRTIAKRYKLYGKLKSQLSELNKARTVGDDVVVEDSSSLGSEVVVNVGTWKRRSKLGQSKGLLGDGSETFDRNASVTRKEEENFDAPNKQEQMSQLAMTATDVISPEDDAPISDAENAQLVATVVKYDDDGAGQDSKKEAPLTDTVVNHEEDGAGNSNDEVAIDQQPTVVKYSDEELNAEPSEDQQVAIDQQPTVVKYSDEDIKDDVAIENSDSVNALQSTVVKYDDETPSMPMQFTSVEEETVDYMDNAPQAAVPTAETETLDRQVGAPLTKQDSSKSLASLKSLTTTIGRKDIIPKKLDSNTMNLVKNWETVTRDSPSSSPRPTLKRRESAKRAGSAAKLARFHSENDDSAAQIEPPELKQDTKVEQEPEQVPAQLDAPSEIEGNSAPQETKVEEPEESKEEIPAQATVEEKVVEEVAEPKNEEEIKPAEQQNEMNVDEEISEPKKEEEIKPTEQDNEMNVDEAEADPVLKKPGFPFKSEHPLLRQFSFTPEPGTYEAPRLPTPEPDEGEYEDLKKPQVADPLNTSPHPLKTNKAIVDPELFLRIPKDNAMRCIITRQSGINHPFPVYVMTNEADQKFVMSARRRKKARYPHYIISNDANDLTKKSPGYIAKVKADSSGLGFTIFDARGYSNTRQDKGLTNLAAVIYNKQTLPHDIKVAIKPRDAPDQAEQLKFSENIMKDLIIESPNVLIVRNKNPRRDQGESPALNFYNRVKVPSIKNFQLTDPVDGAVLLQFGRVGDQSFILDFTSPFTPVEAFGIALTAFNGHDQL